MNAQFLTKFAHNKGSNILIAINGEFSMHWYYVLSKLFWSH